MAYFRSHYGLYTAIAGGCLLAFSGCTTPRIGDPYFMDTLTTANVYVSPVAADAEKVAIMPFKAPTELIGTSVSEMFVTEFLRADRYTMVERGQMEKVLSESELALSGLSNADAIEVGKLLDADAVILGTVDEYASVAVKGNTYPSVGVSLRMINSNSGKVLWSVDLSKRSETAGDSLSAHGRQVVHEMVAALYKEWMQYRRPDTPANITVSDMGLREVKIGWTPPVNDNAIKYQIERSESPDGGFAVIGSVAPSKKVFVDRGSDEHPLKDGMTYYYRIVGLGANERRSKPSMMKESFTAPVPSAPSVTDLNAIGPREIKLTWRAPDAEGIVKYEVERRAENQEAFAAAGHTRALEFTEGGSASSPLADSSTYIYRVRAINRVGAMGEWSKPVEVTTPPRPARIAGFKAEQAMVRSVPLSWDASPEESVEYYHIERAIGEGESFELVEKIRGREKTEWIDGGKEPGKLQDDTDYRYRVIALNSVGSTSEAVETRAHTRPLPPAVEKVSADSDLPRKVKVSWSPCRDEKIDGYKVYRRADSNAEFEEIQIIKSTDILEYIDMGFTGFARHSSKTEGPGDLADGTAYQYAVAPYSIAGAEGARSDVAVAVTKSLPKPPTALAVQGGAEKMTLTWIQSESEDRHHYIVERSSGPDKTFREIAQVPAGQGDQLTFDDEKVKPGEEFYYQVITVDADTLQSAPCEKAKGLIPGS